MAETACYVPLPERGLITVAGPEARPFLQGLISNDIEKAQAHRAIYAALLTAQGKFLHDFLIAVIGGDIVLDCERARLGDLGRRLAGYKLRAKVSLADASDDHVVAALLGPVSAEAAGVPPEPGAAISFGGGIAFRDPRHAGLGARAILPAATGFAPLDAAGFVRAPIEAYERLRLTLGIPDGSRDIAVEKATLLESNFEALNGVDFSKGCYVGQELTARTKYRGLVKRRLMRVRVEGALPPAGTPLTLDGKEAGEMRSGLGEEGLALLRLDRLEASGRPLEADGAKIHVLPAEEAAA
ncbi:MAG: folate-binding protein YgfZ [Alphaproteobacteria bacterium]